MTHHPITVITGATSGLGQLAAIALAQRGAHLVLTARSHTRAEATRALLATVAPGAPVDFIFGNLALMQEVRQVGAQIAHTYGRVDVLINNAGIHAFSQRVTADGLPEMAAVNYLAPWLLTQTLWTCLAAAGAARVVNVASEASRRYGTLRLPQDLTDTTPFTARESSLRYGKTKLFNIMFTGELARRLVGTGATANALDPGFNVTGLGRELGFAAGLERVLRWLHIGDPQRGARIITHLATDPALRGVSGGYFSVNGARPLTPVAPAADPVLQAQLWESTALLLDTAQSG
jgi:NAD(P)-dependent dehydrogenase (short-subunit alcohol dehydrogenase family)